MFTEINSRLKLHFVGCGLFTPEPDSYRACYKMFYFENLITSLNGLKRSWYLTRLNICFRTDFLQRGQTEALHTGTSKFGSQFVSVIARLVQRHCHLIIRLHQDGNTSKNTLAFYCNVKSEHTLWILGATAPRRNKMAFTLSVKVTIKNNGWKLRLGMFK